MVWSARWVAVGADGRGSTLVESVALRLDHVTRSFGGLRAVQDVSLVVRQGERRAIIGPNGAGKTTLFNLIAGDLGVSSGVIRLFEQDVTSLPPHRRAALGLARTFQITNLFPGLSVLENSLSSPSRDSSPRSSPCCARSTDSRTRGSVRWPTLRLVGLEDHAATTVRNLSHGEQRQLEIALALAAGAARAAAGRADGRPLARRVPGHG